MCGIDARILLGSVGAVTGELKKDIVETRTFEAEVVDGDPALGEHLTDARHVAEAIGLGDEPAGGLVDMHDRRAGTQQLDRPGQVNIV